MYRFLGSAFDVAASPHLGVARAGGCDAQPDGWRTRLACRRVAVVCPAAVGWLMVGR